MQFANSSASSQPPSQPTKPLTLSASETLTNSDLESLRRKTNDADDSILEELRRLKAAKKAA